MATLEEIRAYAKKKGLTIRADVPTVNPRIAELNKILNTPISSTDTTGFTEEQKIQFEGAKKASKVSRFIGGEKLGQGIGKAIAKSSIEDIAVKETLTQRDKMNALVNELFAAKEQGRDKDVEKLSNLIRDEIQQPSKGARTLTEFQKTVPTTKEIIGSTVRLGATLASGNIGAKVAALSKVGKAVGIGSGIARGAGAGAIVGVVEGTLHGAGIGLEENKNIKGVVGSTIKGGVIGGVTGGIIGGALGGVTGKLNANKLAKEDFVNNFVSPKGTTKVKQQAIREGRSTKSGIFKKSEIVASKRDKQLAESVGDIVSRKKSVVNNIDSIRNKVTEINNGVKKYIDNNRTIFNTNQLRSQFNSSKVENKLIFASDKNAEKTYNAVVDEFMKFVKKKDTSGLFDARQTFDKVPAIKKLLNSEGLGENLRKEIVLDVRRTANKYIASLLPKGNKFRQLLLKESYMLEALGNIADKEVRNIGLNKLQILTRDYPVLKWLVAGLAGGAGVGVGGAIIGSTD